MGIWGAQSVFAWKIRAKYLWPGLFALGIIVFSVLGVQASLDPLLALEDIVILGWQQDRSQLQYWVDVLEAEKDMSPEQLVLLAAACFHLGESSPRDEARHWFGQAEAAALRAQGLASDNPDAVYWAAVAQGRIGSMVPLLRQLAAIEPLHDGLHQVLELDPAHGYAHLALSILYDMAPGRPLSIGSRTQSLFHAEAAYRMDPENPEFAKNLASAYVREGRKAEARELLRGLEQDSSWKTYPGWMEEIDSLWDQIND